MRKELLSIPEAADILSCSTRTVRRLIEERTIDACNQIYRYFSYLAPGWKRIDLIFVRDTAFHPLAFVTGKIPLFSVESTA
jgi:hypothetical protein